MEDIKLLGVAELIKCYLIHDRLVDLYFSTWHGDGHQPIMEEHIADLIIAGGRPMAMAYSNFVRIDLIKTILTSRDLVEFNAEKLFYSLIIDPIVRINLLSDNSEKLGEKRISVNFLKWWFNYFGIFMNSEIIEIIINLLEEGNRLDRSNLASIVFKASLKTWRPQKVKNKVHNDYIDYTDRFYNMAWLTACYGHKEKSSYFKLDSRKLVTLLVKNDLLHENQNIEDAMIIFYHLFGDHGPFSDGYQLKWKSEITAFYYLLKKIDPNIYDPNRSIIHCIIDCVRFRSSRYRPSKKTNVTSAIYSFKKMTSFKSYKGVIDQIVEEATIKI